jgi:hypothetical protein
MTHPQPGQIWADNDPRATGRTIRIDHIANGKAICTVLTNRTAAQDELDRGSTWLNDTRGKTVGIRLDRFRPTSTGYRLVQHADGTTAEGSSER